DGVTVVPFGQGFASMSAPAKEFEKLIIGGVLNHGANPLLRWAAANVAVETDAAENIKPSKVKSHQRIDPIVALSPPGNLRRGLHRRSSPVRRDPRFLPAGIWRPAI
ncbi:MAG TPA: terminase TerL endonuclease subunit, partial [Dongiaceae bacterium]